MSVCLKVLCVLLCMQCLLTNFMHTGSINALRLLSGSLRSSKPAVSLRVQDVNQGSFLLDVPVDGTSIL